jgi:hypothetical protein
MQNADLPVSVVAPSKTPRQAAPDSKTDSLDARKLAEAERDNTTRLMKIADIIRARLVTRRSWLVTCVSYFHFDIRRSLFDIRYSSRSLLLTAGFS